jgi:hypothetical protein
MIASMILQGFVEPTTCHVLAKSRTRFLGISPRGEIAIPILLTMTQRRGLSRPKLVRWMPTCTPSSGRYSLVNISRPAAIFLVAHHTS